MKKILPLMLMLMLLISGTALASPTVGVLLIGDSSYKTTNFYDYVKEYMEGKGDYRLLISDDFQGKWQEYWLDKGELEEQKPTKNDLLSFVSYSGCDKVLYLICKDPVTDKKRAGLFGEDESWRTSVSVNAFLCNKEGVVKTSNISREDDSNRSELRARRGAFKKAVREISATMNPLLAQ